MMLIPREAVEVASFRRLERIDLRVNVGRCGSGTGHY
jgi:hypothetical protein